MRPVVVSVGVTGLSLRVRAYSTAGDGAPPVAVPVNRVTVTELASGDYSVAGLPYPLPGRTISWALYRAEDETAVVYTGTVESSEPRPRLPLPGPTPRYSFGSPWIARGSSSRADLWVGLSEEVDPTSVLFTLRRLGVPSASPDPSTSSGIAASMTGQPTPGSSVEYLLSCPIPSSVTATLDPGTYSGKFVVNLSGGDSIILPPDERFRLRVA